MRLSRITRTGWIFCGLALAAALIAAAQTKDLGNGFRDHGVAVPISNERGTALAVDGEGRKVLLVLLMDHRGGHGLLMFDVATGKAEQYPMPFPPPGASVDSPYASLLSSGSTRTSATVSPSSIRRSARSPFAAKTRSPCSRWG